MKASQLQMTIINKEIIWAIHKVQEGLEEDWIALIQEEVPDNITVTEDLTLLERPRMKIIVQ